LAERAARSVLSQTYPAIELTLVDDGSTDETLQVFERLREESLGRVRVFHQENRGVSAARNLGLRHCRGELFALLDSDDYWLPHKCERQVAYMRETGCVICQTEEIWIRKGVRVNPKRKHSKPSGKFFAKALETCLVSPSTTMFTRGFWEEVGPFDESLPACEDYDLWLRTLLKHTVERLPEALAVRDGGRPDQLSGRIIGLDLYRIYSLRKLLVSEELDEEQRELTRAALRRKCDVYVRGCLKRDRSEEAARVKELVEKALAWSASG
jgi:glycosyltransferase involved in cell wall biosynthesis